MATDLKSLFLLDPEVTYLNHGSFGACPRPVFEDYQNWQLKLEREPVDFLVRQVRGLFKQDRGGPLDGARAALAEYVNAPVESIAFTLNATTALNTVARSIELNPGDEVLATDHEYGSIEATWELACQKARAKITRHKISLPVTTHADFVEDFWSSVTSRTRVILISHITSASALILPIEEICRRAREAGITTAIDGAHAVGQIPLDLAAINPDYYTSNCHKWLCTPKGSAFIYVHPDRQDALEPLVYSWAWVNQQPFSLVQEMWGTMDISAYLCIPAALDFFKKHNWDEVRKDCRAMAVEARRKMVDIIGLPTIAPENEGWLPQMAAVTLPDSIDARNLWDRLYEDYRIEALAQERAGRNLLRISLQGYNTQDDLDRLYAALKVLL